MITDPWFYAAAIPAVLLMGLSKSGFGAGFGSLATPLMALSITVPQAAAIMLPLLLVMDAVGVKALFQQRDKALIRLLIPAGLLGTVLGTLSFGLLQPKTVAGIVGGLTLLFLAQRLLFPPRADAPPPPRWLGFGLGIASGFTSFVAHAGAPPVSAYVLPLRLPPMIFTATMATFFAVVNLSKWIPYAFLGLIDLRNLGTSLVLMPFAPVGVWIGIRLAKRIQPTLFYRLVYVGMFLTGAKLLYDALR
ncbi:MULTISPECIES: sulfite exporter TauE/SafE family protein [unclassified Rhizobacter]|uniref:sulfite exporter TauE/SafE family protein n=1 Tax=unclassified Rhizobacter TaxID=2640088 RepID=UPI0006FAFF95|nr:MULTISPECIES: sulfite exporter TauE/SafE family protein [unclassified Rhizobacter]KQU64534.1 permease [Rhizobacter sp. Root29]KQW11589.1 permease [Rhizobacter sp. Root1238]KRB19845.1 permease [Rhizobacter sp. Root16D2]